MTVTSERDLRWNFAVALVDAAGWGLGLGLVSAATFLPLFVRQLSGSTLAVGLISAGMTFGWYVPGILVARHIERLAVVKRYVMALAMVERSFLLLVVPLIYLVGARDRGALLVSFLVCWFLMNLAMGCNSPAYYKLIAKTIPAGVRGRLYGIGGAVAGLLGIGAGEIAGQLIARLGYPHGYALCFAAAFAVQTVTVIPLGFMREPPSKPERVTHRRDAEAGEPRLGREADSGGGRSPGEKGSTSELFVPFSASSAPLAGVPARLEGDGLPPSGRGRAVQNRPSVAPSPLELLRRDPNLVRLIASHVLFSGSLMAAGFYTDYAIRHFGAGPRIVGHFTSAVMGSQVLASLLCGLTADRHGNKWVLQLATACGVGAALLAVTAQSLFAFYPIFALSQIAATGWSIAAFNFVLELCGEARAATYTALSTLLTGPFKAGMPLLGAALIHLYGYTSVFAVAAVVTALALVVLTRGMTDPRHAKAVRGARCAVRGSRKATACRPAKRYAPALTAHRAPRTAHRERSEP
jgi:MFS family permease